jgi:hypothetical protein
MVRTYTVYVHFKLFFVFEIMFIFVHYLKNDLKYKHSALVRTYVQYHWYVPASDHGPWYLSTNGTLGTKYVLEYVPKWYQWYSSTMVHRVR